MQFSVQKKENPLCTLSVYQFVFNLLINAIMPFGNIKHSFTVGILHDMIRAIHKFFLSVIES